jgi:hypothetical protein
VVVAAISSTMTSWLVSGRPRQFMLMCENSRCSISFHVLVPGGRWQTVMDQGLEGNAEDHALDTGSRSSMSSTARSSRPSRAAGFEPANTALVSVDSRNPPVADTEFPTGGHQISP